MSEAAAWRPWLPSFMALRLASAASEAAHVAEALPVHDDYLWCRRIPEAAPNVGAAVRSRC